MEARGEDSSKVRLGAAGQVRGHRREVSQSWSYLDTILSRMDLMVGEREGDDVRRAGRKALYEVNRESKESLNQYVSRREVQMQEAESHELWMSDKLKGYLLEEGAQLTAQSLQNLRTLTRGDLRFCSVAWALRQMDHTAQERLLPSGLSSRPL